MEISSRIKELRIHNNLTQEEFGEMLGVSSKAISRWENNITYPDISLIPEIAKVFKVTTDYLLGIDIDKENEEVNAALHETSRLLGIGNLNIEHTHKIEDLANKYPTNWDIKFDLYNCYVCLHMYDETIKLGEYIRSNCKDVKKINDIIFTLTMAYINKGDIEKAKEIAELLPKNIYATKWWLRTNFLTGEDKIVAVEKQIQDIAKIFSELIIRTYKREEEGKRDKILLKIIEFYNLIFDDGDYYFNEFNICDIYERCAIDQAKIKNTEKVIEYLNEALNHSLKLIKIFNDKSEIKHTSFLVDRIIEYPQYWGFTGKENYRLTNSILHTLDTADFEYLKNNEEIKKIKEICENNKFSLY